MTYARHLTVTIADCGRCGMRNQQTVSMLGTCDVWARTWQICRGCMLTLCYVMDDTAKRGIVPLGDGGTHSAKKSDREWIAARTGESKPLPPPPPEPPLTDRFTAALNASALPAHAKMGGIESITLVSVFTSFYALAERYGATHPKDIAKLASVITNRKASPFKPPDWMISDDEDKAVIIKSHERRAISQWSGYVHPYTCNDDPCRGKTNGAPLHPKREGGWVCLHCGLHQ